MVFVNHGDDDSCTGLAESIQERFGITAYAPFSGAEYDLKKGEWIRLTEPVYRKKEGGRTAEARQTKEKEAQLYRSLMEAAEDLQEYAARMKGHANSEIRKLTDRIRDLMRSGR